MTRRTIELTDELYAYLLSVSLREPEVLRRLREETAEHPKAQMQISPEQGQFMAFLMRLIDARRTVELGVFTGYSALSAALALPPDGEVVACEIDEEYAAIARGWWEEAGVDLKIDLRLGPALETLDGLLASGEADAFDFAFVDADKENYSAYYERCLRLVRPGGLILFDNTLWGGAVVDPEVTDATTEALRALNVLLHQDERIDLSLLPVADGLTLARRR
ncbi:MAG: class I SAM-dependent methyltransferase [Gemmatimonadota bacterium]